MPASFEAALREALAHLPGVEAHRRMAPTPRHPWNPALFPHGPRDAAALLLLYPGEKGWHIPLTLRGSELRSHTGQVSLPGGRVDAGESIETAALREAAEEIGVMPESVRVLGQLTPLHIPVSGYVLHPVVGLTSSRPVFRPATWEVARLIEVPLASLRDPAIVRRTERLRELDGRRIDTPYFAIEGEEVWGATAMVLAEFLAIVEKLE